MEEAGLAGVQCLWSSVWGPAGSPEDGHMPGCRQVPVMFGHRSCWRGHVPSPTALYSGRPAARFPPHRWWRWPCLSCPAAFCLAYKASLAIPLAANPSCVSKAGQQVSTFFCKYLLSGISFISSCFSSNCLGDRIAHQTSVPASPHLPLPALVRT